MKHITWSTTVLATLLTALPTAWAYSTEIYAAGDVTDGINTGDTAATALLIRGYFYSRVIVPGDANNVNYTLVPGETHIMEYENYYHPYWGDFLYDTWPVPGNHDYDGGSITDYMTYMDMNGVNGGKTYYDYTESGWYFLALDSECAKQTTCGQEQLAWLNQKLTDNAGYACTLAYYHRPRFSDGEHGDNNYMGDIWTALYNGGVDVVINGHDHSYERFEPMNPSGGYDPSGMYEFVVGTGGADTRPFPVDESESDDKVPRDTSAVRIGETNGVLWLGLDPTSFSATFYEADGTSAGVVRDSIGNVACYY